MHNCLQWMGRKVKLIIVLAGVTVICWRILSLGNTGCKKWNCYGCESAHWGLFFRISSYICINVSVFISSFVRVAEAVTSYTATVGGMNCLHRRVREIIAVGVLSGLQSSDWTQGREFEYQFFFPPSLSLCYVSRDERDFWRRVSQQWTCQWSVCWDCVNECVCSFVDTLYT